RSRGLEIMRRGELAGELRTLQFGAFDHGVDAVARFVDVEAVLVDVDRENEFLAGVETGEVDDELCAAVGDGEACDLKAGVADDAQPKRVERAEPAGGDV